MLLIITIFHSFIHLTRMHSSRMRTGRSLTVWRRGGLLAGGGSPCWGGSPCKGGLSLPGGALLARGVGSPWWGSLPARGVSLLGGSPCWGVSLPGESPCQGGSPCQGVSLVGCWGVSLPGGFSLLGGLLDRGFSLLETPPVNRMINRCKNITLATTSLRPVIKQVAFQSNANHPLAASMGYIKSEGM